MKHIFKKVLAARKRGDTIVIVSGLPRCGTSMMMQMLEAGGMAIVTDNIKTPDEDNPRGYYEYEKVKKIREDASWLKNCNGKVIKMVSALLYYLPKGKKYKVIFMVRDMEEMFESQEAVLQRLGGEGVDISYEEMIEKLKKHLLDVKDWVARQRNIEVTYIDYNEVIQNPQRKASLVSQFLKGQVNVEKMSTVVDKSLYRKRNKQ